MDITYTVQGADGNAYGPVTFDQLKGWVTEGRIQSDTQILRSDTNTWQPASAYSELAIPVGTVQPVAGAPVAAMPASPLPVPTQASATLADLEKRIRGGASWFYWIAALTLVNTIVVHSGSDMSFVLGLMASQIIDFGAVHSGETIARIVALVVDAIAIGMFVLFGVFANKKHRWAFAVGIGIYSIDTLLVLVGRIWLGLAIHAFALFGLVNGFRGALEWRRQNAA